MESIPVSGVEIRKDRHAPLLAPCFLNPATAGTTPHDHMGIGIPRIEALITDRTLPRRKYRFTVSGDK